MDLQTGVETVVHSFVGGSDGASPESTLLLVGGGFYGTTYTGGAARHGTLFKIDPTTGDETVVYGFKKGSAEPIGSLTCYNNTLYGLTEAPRTKEQILGAAFAFDLDTNDFTVLHTFGNAGDGAFPDRLLLVGKAFFGATQDGGANFDGTIFTLDPSTKDEAVLHSFDGTDGSTPVGLVFLGGSLYGTAFGGGAASNGVLFSMDPNTGVETVGHTFTGGTDGYSPGDLITAGGNIYGTTFGSFGTGTGETVFKLTP